MNLLDSNAVRININSTLMPIMLCYDYSFQIELLNKAYMTPSDILKLNYKNLMLYVNISLSRLQKKVYQIYGY